MTPKTPNRSSAPKGRSTELLLNWDLFRVGERVCVAVSGGADSTALLRVLLDRREKLGIVLSVVHVNHRLRGEAAEQDAEFVVKLAEEFGLQYEIVAVDTATRAKENHESIEEAARNLRYEAFRDVLNSGRVDKIATAHTLDDQAETVLMKLLRGAWTEGMSGIHPKLRLRKAAFASAEDSADCVRPLLAVRRAEIETYLRALDQTWQEDVSNQSLAHTRNRVRHELLPLMRQYNLHIDVLLAQMAANAQAEEQHWHAELVRVLPHVLLPGKPVRGGGRTVDMRPGGASVAVDLARLTTLDFGLQRRVLRAAAKECGIALDFMATECLLRMTGPSKRLAEHKSAKRLELPDGVRVERSARELQFDRQSTAAPSRGKSRGMREPYQQVGPHVYELVVPGTVDAVSLGTKFTAELSRPSDATVNPRKLLFRVWQPGDRVELRHSSGPKKVKEVLERMRLSRKDKEIWPVAVWKDRIVWMRGVDVLQMPLESGVNTSNHGKSCIFVIREAQLAQKALGKGNFQR